MTLPAPVGPWPPLALRRVVQPLWVLLAALGLVACGGGGGGSPTPDPQPANPSAIASAQPGEVLDYVKRKLAARGPQGAGRRCSTSRPGWTWP
jgi:hypothetical protein